MWTLIRREIEEILPFMMLTLMLIILVIIIQSGIYLSDNNYDEINFRQASSIMIILVFLMVPFPLIFFFLGADQIGRDRTRKISAFLCTLATTRNRIFSAKLIAGAIQLLAVFIPMTVIGVIISGWIEEPSFHMSSFWQRLLAALFFINAAAYSLGMMTGERVTIPILYVALGLVASVILDGLLFIKGPDLINIVLLLILIVGAIAETRRRFLIKPL